MLSQSIISPWILYARHDILNMFCIDSSVASFIIGWQWWYYYNSYTYTVRMICSAFCPLYIAAALLLWRELWVLFVIARASREQGYCAAKSILSHVTCFWLGFDSRYSGGTCFCWWSAGFHFLVWHVYFSHFAVGVGFTLLATVARQSWTVNR